MPSGYKAANLMGQKGVGIAFRIHRGGGWWLLRLAALFGLLGCVAAPQEVDWEPRDLDAGEPGQYLLAGPRKGKLGDTAWYAPEDSLSTFAFVRSQQVRAKLLSDEGRLGESLHVLDRLVNRLIAQRRHKELAVLRNSIGELLGMLGDYSRSMQHLHRAYDLALHAGDTTQMLIANNIIAKHCAAIGNYELAHEYLKRSLVLIGSDTISGEGAQVYHIYGEVCLGYENPELAVQFFDQALRIAQRLGKDREFAHVLQDLALAQISLGKAPDARRTIQSMQQLRAKDLNYINRIYLHRVIGRYEQAFGEVARARAAYDSAYRAALHIGNPALQVELLEDLGQLSRDVGDRKRAYELFVRAQDMRDSLKEFLSSKRFILADMQAAQRSKLLEMQRADVLQEDTYSYTLLRQRITLYAAILIAVWVVFVLYFTRCIYQKRMRMHEELVDRKRRIEANYEELLRLTNSTIELRNETIIQGNLIEQTRQEVQHNSDMLMSSIDHASSIQRAIFPVDEVLRQWLPDHFILMRPRDLVSSALPWVGRLGQNVMVLALVDCQGRSAAGASLTFIAYMLLNEIVIDYDELDPASVVQELNDRMGRLLVSVREGYKREIEIKIAVLTVRVEESAAEFVGLGLDLYYTLDRSRIYRIEGENGTMNLRGEGLQLEAHRIAYGANTVFYLTSDGYLNQLNQRGERMGRERFGQLLERIQGLPLAEQERELFEQHMRHRLGVEQTEDIVVGSFSPPVLAHGDGLLGA